MAGAMPLASIVIPVYNMGKELEGNIGNVLGQSYKNIEIILVDDGSEDGTWETCISIAASDSRVRCVQVQHQGAGGARNAGIAAASGKYIYFPDADDVVSTKLIEAAAVAMERDGCDLAVFGFTAMRPDGTRVKSIRQPCTMDGREIRGNYHRHSGMYGSLGIQGAPWNKMFRLDRIKEWGIKFPPMPRHQDEAFILQYMDRAEKVAFIGQELYGYKQNAEKEILKKYPTDYFDTAQEMLGYWMRYTYRWNPGNQEMVRLICGYYLKAARRALMLCTAPGRFGGLKGRMLEVRRISGQFINTLPDPGYVDKSVFLRFMRTGNCLALYLAACIARKKEKGWG